MLPTNKSQRLAVLTCSDLPTTPSRVFELPPDQLFIIQTVACIGSTSTLASLCHVIERYAVDLVVVLGHSGCRVIEHCCAIPGAFGLLGREVEGSRQQCVALAHGGAASGAEGRASPNASLASISACHTMRMARSLKRALLPSHAVEIIPMQLDEQSGRTNILHEPTQLM